MNRLAHRSLISFFFTITMLFQATANAATPIDNSLAPMLESVMPAVVNIKAQIKVTDLNTLQALQKQRQNGPKNNNQGDPNSFVSVASGVIIDEKNGYIITNSHVINDAQSIIVTLSDGRHFTAKILGADKPSDIALLQIKGKNIAALPMADSNTVKVGDFVAAIGNPFGLNHSVTSGIVSAIGRTTLGIENYENFIQTDAPINPGNSGGALINMSGQLIGMNTAILAPDRGSIGIGFAIPSNMVKSVILQLIQFGNVKRGLLGISAQDITPELAGAFNSTNVKGAAITQVYPDSPAQQAGLQVGDIITAVNGSAIKSASDVVNTVGFLRVDSKINIDIIRNGKSMKATVTLTDPSKRKQIAVQSDPFLYGVGLQDFTLLSPVHGNVNGIMVISVDQDSNAWQSDLRPGDVITSINQQKVTNINELKAGIAKAGKILLVNVLRGMGAVYLVITKEEA